MPTNHFPHDSAYKALFSFPSMVKSLLLDFLPEEFVRYFDFSTLAPAKSSFVRKDLKQLHDDIIWRLNWKGKPSVLALILEFQSSDDYWMGARILAYTSN
ncbi:MAG: Rpn family recombination-promoting nuclease/putative transposase, partial [Desulfovibrio sp.]|nr:Rpn family recombination-promoting nuclease/putative transposase [Desulfovibrio sp.]